MGKTVSPDLLVAPVQIAGGPRSVEMPRHVNEPDAEILVLQLRHGVKIGLDHAVLGSVGRLSAPGPDDDVDFRMTDAPPRRVDRPQVGAGVVDPVRIVADIPRHRAVADIQGAARPARVPGVKRICGSQGVHAGDELAAVRGVAVGDVQSGLGGRDLRRRNIAEGGRRQVIRDDGAPRRGRQVHRHDVVPGGIVRGGYRVGDGQRKIVGRHGACLDDASDGNRHTRGGERGHQRRAVRSERQRQRNGVSGNDAVYAQNRKRGDVLGGAFKGRR